MIGEVIGHIEEKNGNKYFVFFELWDRKNINDGKCKYGKDFTKIKFDTDYNLALNKPLNLHMLAITVRSVFDNEGKFYPQVYSDECLYEI